MTEEIRQHALARYEAIDRVGRVYLERHPRTPRYCYTCQVWLEGAREEAAHPGHSIH